MDDNEAELLFASLDQYCSLPAGVVNDPFHIFEGFTQRDSPTSDASGSCRSESSRTTDDLKRHHDGEQKVVRLSRPRIPKNDFRRQYANMWVNVFNSCDKDLMNKHLDTFYDRNVLVRQNDVREDHSQCPQKIPFFQQSARGVEYLAQLWYAGMSAAPDLACSLRHTYVKVRSDGSSVIRCCFSLKGTQVSNLDNQSRESIEKIARYQAYKAAGRRGITITEAAVAAVAPTTMNLSRSRSAGSGGSSPKNRATSAAGAVDAAGDRKKETGNAASAATAAIPALTIQIKQENPAPPHPPQQSIPAKAKAPIESDQPMDVDEDVRPVPPRSGAKLSPTAASTSSASSSIAPTATSSAPAGNSHNSGAGQGDINWLAMAEYAYSAGTLEPCQAQTQKKYFYSNETSANVSRNHSAATTPRVRSADNIQDATPASKPAVQEEEAAGSVFGQKNVLRENEMSQDPDVDSLAEKMSRTVITAAIDCICAIELELNPDNVITSVVLHYFR